MVHEERQATGNLCPRNLDGPTKTAMRNAEDERSQTRAFQNEPEWRDVKVPHGGGALYWCVVVVALAAAAAAAVVESLKVEARRASALSRHCQWKPGASRLKAKPSRMVPVQYFSRCDPRALG